MFGDGGRARVFLLQVMTQAPAVSPTEPPVSAPTLAVSSYAALASGIILVAHVKLVALRHFGVTHEPLHAHFQGNSPAIRWSDCAQAKNSRAS